MIGSPSQSMQPSYISKAALDLINAEAGYKKPPFGVSAVSNAITDAIAGSQTKRAIFRFWGGHKPIAMGEGVRFRVTKSKFIDYVYVRCLDGIESFEVEFGALVGTEYDILDRVKPVLIDQLQRVISQHLFKIIP